MEAASDLGIGDIVYLKNDDPTKLYRIIYLYEDFLNFVDLESLDTDCFLVNMDASNLIRVPKCQKRS